MTIESPVCPVLFSYRVPDDGGPVFASFYAEAYPNGTVDVCTYNLQDRTYYTLIGDEIRELAAFFNAAADYAEAVSDK